MKNCDEIYDCRGPGYSEHIEHVLARVPFSSLVGEILRHCPNGPNSLLSCGCCDYAEEIGRRSTIEGQLRHRKAAQDHKRYLEEKKNVSK